MDTINQKGQAEKRENDEALLESEAQSRPERMKRLSAAECCKRK